MIVCEKCGRPSDDDIPYNIDLILRPCINCGGGMADECKLPSYTIRQWEIWKSSFKNLLHDYKPWEFNEDGDINGTVISSSIKKYWNIPKK